MGEEEHETSASAERADLHLGVTSGFRNSQNSELNMLELNFEESRAGGGGKLEGLAASEWLDRAVLVQIRSAGVHF